MALFQRFGDNTAVAVFCGLLLLAAILFFIVVYVADFKEGRAKAKKRREYERSVAHAQRRRQKAH